MIMHAALLLYRHNGAVGALFFFLFFFLTKFNIFSDMFLIVPDEL